MRSSRARFSRNVPATGPKTSPLAVAALAAAVRSGKSIDVAALRAAASVDDAVAMIL